MANIGRAKPQHKVGKCFASLYPMWGKGAPVVFWAEDGRVRCRDERPTTDPAKRFNSVPWREMAYRVLSFSQMIVQDSNWHTERQRAQQWVCEMENVLKEAAEQAEDPAGNTPLKTVASNWDRPVPKGNARPGDNFFDERN